MIRITVLLTAQLLSALATAQEFRPYPAARITTSEWQSYFEVITSKYGQSARVAPNQPLVVFDDGSSTQYAFTRPGHRAHPAWVARRVVEKSGKIYIDQVGYFAGDEKAFAVLFNGYKALNENTRQEMNTQK